MARAKVFRDPQGNRMLFPCHIYDKREDEPLETELWGFSQLLRTATGLKMEDDWLEIDPTDFPHVRTEIGSRGFAHGAATVLLFDGPEFHSN